MRAHRPAVDAAPLPPGLGIVEPCADCQKRLDAQARSPEVAAQRELSRLQFRLTSLEISERRTKTLAKIAYLMALVCVFILNPLGRLFSALGITGSAVLEVGG